MGFITQGRYSQEVYRASSVLVSPRLVYIIVDRVITAMYGNASAKYSDGTQLMGLLPLLCGLLLLVSFVYIFTALLRNSLYEKAYP